MNRERLSTRQLNRRRQSRGQQRGAVSIEFVLLFPLLLAIFYAIISYAISFAQLHVLNGMAAESTRAAVAVVTTGGGARERIDGRIESVVERYNGILQVAGCGVDGDKFDFDTDTAELTVCLETAALLPSLNIFGIRIPQIDGPLKSQSSIRLGQLDI
ncbi:TadE family protein [uncultured Halomonas sp.]|uniref:TadE family protein n=1 Tax=uncultured Halomonas sp. TaxID=173971 RepID=UPI00261E0596|nr:TadE family protein [uncultured Halomonas sp.]